VTWGRRERAAAPVIRPGDQTLCRLVDMLAVHRDIRPQSKDARGDVVMLEARAA
jgi:hypothetical protein